MGSTQSQKLPGDGLSGGLRASAPPPSRAPLSLLRPPAPSRRSPERQLRDDLSSGGLKLSAPVGPGQVNRADDVYGVEQVLFGSGLLKRAPGTQFDKATAAAIGEGQKRLNGEFAGTVGGKPLKIDGLINPDGPTQRATRGLATEVSGQWRTRREQRPAEFTDIPKPPSASRRSPLQGDIRAQRKAMTADDAGSLHRLARGLGKTSEPGAAAGDIAHAINSGDPKAIAEFQVIREELGRIGSKDQVRALDKAVINNVTKKQRHHLLELTQRPDRRAGQPLEMDRQDLKDARDGKDNVNFNAGTDEDKKVPDDVSTPQNFRRLRGTTFFGGAGMEGPYVADMVEAMKEAGVKNVRIADRSKWSKGEIPDAVDVIDKRYRDDGESDLSGMGTEGEQFNLVGYSYGGLQASQAAIDHADRGGRVDHLVLVGTPISKEFLDKQNKHPNINKVEVIDLQEYGDPIKAGMSTGELAKSLPELGLDLSFGSQKDKKGHFYYGGNSAEGQRRRRALARQLKEMGMK